MPAGGLFTAAAIGSAAVPFFQKSPKFKAQQLPSLKELTGQAVQAQGVALEGGISNLGRFGTQFLESQRAAQERFDPSFFKLKREQAQGQANLARQLIGGDLGQLLGRGLQQRQFGGLTQRGVGESLSQRFRGSVALAAQQAQLQQSGLNLLGQSAQTGIETPFGLQAFTPDIPQLGGLIGQAGSLASQQANFNTQAAMFRVQQKQQQQADRAQGIAKIAGGFAGVGGLPGGSGGIDMLKAFSGGAGIGATSQSSVGTT